MDLEVLHTHIGVALRNFEHRVKEIASELLTDGKIDVAVIEAAVDKAIEARLEGIMQRLEASLSNIQVHVEAQPAPVEEPAGTQEPEAASEPQPAPEETVQAEPAAE